LPFAFYRFVPLLYVLQAKIHGLFIKMPGFSGFLYSCLFGQVNLCDKPQHKTGGCHKKRRDIMKNILKLSGIIALVAIIGLSMSSCATNVAAVRHGWDRHHIHNLPDTPYLRDYTILGVVQLEGTRRGFIRFGIPFTNIEGFLWQGTLGTVSTYANLLAEARRQFPTANAVTNIQIDRVDSNVWFFFSTRRYTMTGLAIEFAAQSR